MADKLTVVLAGGGTGGHVYPALAMGEALSERGHTLLYFGDADRLEGRVAPQRGVPFTAIPALQYPRAGLASKIRFALGLLKTILYSRRELKKSGATLVLGVGGYIAAPPVLAAWTLGIPRIIHESNVTPGMANKLCARFADLVMVTYEQTGAKLPGDAPREVVGCPVNPRVLQGDRSAAAARYGIDPARSTLLVVGGSLGAATINQLAAAGAALTDRAWQIIWITGPRYLKEITSSLGVLPEGVILVGYEDRMGDAYAAADLVLCRAGSSTLAELTVLGKPSILVPSPNVTDNHQEANARGLESAGAAVVVVERDLDVSSTVIEIDALLSSAERLSVMSESAKSLGQPDTAGMVADLIEGRFS
ncbi:MAG: undecaprenyldiphospho-muramoylpentapeptide beta-N-acetylglucosaminyltransferase [Myxococcota bacterium]|nr:undecaprenyldiphospho-muramoylpentapeptide beta-N-acetylglucosaminyltransferase [Myxococcota bacterium]